jgi:hypothetical protein
MRHNPMQKNGTPANRRLLVALSATLAAVLVLVVLAAVVVGPGGTIEWIATYLLPVIALLGVVTAIMTLVVWMQKGIIGKLPTLSFYQRQWWR